MLKRFDGTNWVDTSTHRKFDGANWVDCSSAKRWDGANWVECLQNEVYLGLVKLGTLYVDNAPKLRATRPWIGNRYDDSGNGTNFWESQPITRWKIGDTHSADEYKLQWNKVRSGGKTLLISDRVILCKIQWDTLHSAGYVTGKQITIDGHSYLCRLPTGGADSRSSYEYDGGTLRNEWDDIICNEENIAGFPTPSYTDLDSIISSDTDFNSVHNKIWNWYSIRSWCKETRVNGRYTEGTLRGGFSAKYWDSSDTRYTNLGDQSSYGWRPVLELI